MHWVRILAAVAGAVVVLAAGRSLLQVVVVPRGSVGTVLKLADHLVDRVFRLLGRLARTYERRDRLLSAQGPTVLIAVLVFWLAAFLLGYGLLLWPALGHLRQALRESGSSLFTLGFLSHPGAWPTLVDFAAAATGLVVVALQIAYLPTLYNAFNRRETEVTLLAVRAGEPAWGAELLARTWITNGGDDLPALYQTWIRWAADVTESHPPPSASAPPSPTAPGSSPSSPSSLRRPLRLPLPHPGPPRGPPLPPHGLHLLPEAGRDRRPLRGP